MFLRFQPSTFPNLATMSEVENTIITNILYKMFREKSF
jgi:hypothetical protein